VPKATPERDAGAHGPNQPKVMQPLCKVAYVGSSPTPTFLNATGRGARNAKTCPTVPSP